ncbi:MAG: thioredoxin family protein [Ardenticatenaceae bacterium]
MATIDITEENFNDTISDNDIVFIDFWASWCGPCRSFAPVFKRASNKHTDIVFGKINTEEQQALAGSFNVRSIPTLSIFKEKVLVFSQPGALPPPALDSLAEQVRALDMDEVRKQMAEEQKK